ncbi:MAG: hypothetical protein LBN26_05170, partial [Christensenellaceae bacterium]|nr:hypothetical protein [Christensenellaceae bacterium]
MSRLNEGNLTIRPAKQFLAIALTLIMVMSLLASPFENRARADKGIDPEIPASVVGVGIADVNVNDYISFGTAPYSFEILSGFLPEGITFDPLTG